jgi:hypothetical protein
LIVKCPWSRPPVMSDGQLLHVALVDFTRATFRSIKA